MRGEHLKNKDGSILVVFLLGMLLLTVFLSASLMFIHETSQWVRLQNQIDQCVIRKAAFSRNTLNKLGALNDVLSTLKILEKAGLATVLLPPVLGANIRMGMDKAIDLVVSVQNRIISGHDLLSRGTPLECLTFISATKEINLNELLTRAGSKKGLLKWEKKSLPKVSIIYKKSNFSASSEATVFRSKKSPILTTGNKYELTR